MGWRRGPTARNDQMRWEPSQLTKVVPDLVAKAEPNSTMASYDVRFEVWGFSLYEHGADAVWRPQRDFPLGQELPGPRSE